MATSTVKRKPRRSKPPRIAIDSALLERTVFGVLDNGAVEFINLCETPEEARAFAAGFSFCHGWDDSDLTEEGDCARVGMEALEAALENLDEASRDEFLRAAKGGAK